jgi:hypothetical protein
MVFVDDILVFVDGISELVNGILVSWYLMMARCVVFVVSKTVFYILVLEYYVHIGTHAFRGTLY